MNYTLAKDGYVHQYDALCCLSPKSENMQSMVMEGMNCHLFNVCLEK